MRDVVQDSTSNEHKINRLGVYFSFLRLSIRFHTLSLLHFPLLLFPLLHFQRPLLDIWLKIIANCGICCCVTHTQRGFTPLHMAAKFGKLKVARLLLDKGADANVEGKYRLTPLHVATHYGSTDVALLLLDRDAKPQCTAKVLLSLLWVKLTRNSN